ncbi:MAG: hypothetical protein IKP66_03340, partial [Lachnospiraceae bacterium]|nr:hypothetical protein [Lachnospiraceae bacterium]
IKAYKSDTKEGVIGGKASMKGKLRFVVTKVLLFITMLAATGILTSCEQTIANTYGCPASKRVKKLQLQRIKKLR